MSYTKNTTTGAPRVLDNNKYYAFGMNHLNQLQMSGYNPLSVPYNYKYSGKELQETGFYDYGWRHYMPDIGRWNGIDQLAEKYYSTSPYAYVVNNPISFIDPDGRKVVETADGWTFTGSDIQGVLNYFSNGGDYSTFVRDLENGGGSFGSSPVSNHWGNYNPGPSWFSRAWNYLFGKKKQEAPKATGHIESGDAELIEWNEDELVDERESEKNEDSGSFSPWGPALIALGEPLDFLKPVGALGSEKGSSIASWGLSKTFPQKSPWLKQTTRKVATKVVGKKAANKMGTAVVGRFAGRLVPGVGWVLFGYDIYDNRDFLFNTISAGAKDFYDMNERARNGERYADGTPIPFVCFQKGTLIYSSIGFIPIEDINVEDSVYSYNLKTNTTELSKVINTFYRKTEAIFELTFNDETVYVTAEHPFYIVGKGWVKVKDLSIGDELQTVTKEKSIKIESILLQKKDVIVYNIEVDKNHNYFITNEKILVHNKNIEDNVNTKK